MSLAATTLALLLIASPVPAGAPPAPEIELAGADAGAVRTPSDPGAWGGPRTGKEPTLSDRVADYAIRAVLDPVKHVLEGTERLTWRNRSEVPVRSVYLHLYLNAFESEGSTFMQEKARLGLFRSGVETKDGEWGSIDLRRVVQGGLPATWTVVHPDGGPATDRTVVRVDLPEPVPPGGTTTLEIDFVDRLPRVVARSGWFGTFHMVGQWYPKIGVLELPGERGAVRPRWNAHEYHLFSEFYADFGAYDLEVVVPEGYRVAASGVPVGRPVAGPDGVSWRFRAEDVHDVAFTAWNGFAEPLTATWKGPGSPEVKVEVWHPPEFAPAAREALQATLDALAWFSRTLGPYPYPHLTVLVPPFNADEAGGMEYETFFTTIGSNRFPGNAEGLTRYVTAHEFGHGYFMGILATNEFEEPFLDEGMNEWWNARMLGEERFRLRLPAWARWLGLEAPGLSLWDGERAMGTSRHLADPIAGNSWNRWSSGSYSAVYGRTAVSFHDLEQAIGTPLVEKAMRLYHERWKFRHPSTADLKEAFVDAGADRAVVEAFFEAQVFASGPVDDRIVTVRAEEVLPPLGLGERDGERAELTAKGRRKAVEEAREAWRKANGEPGEGKPGPFPWRNVIAARRFAAAVPQVVVVTFEDGSVERLDWPASQAWGRWELVRPVKVRSAQLDEGRAVFLDLDKLDDGRTREARGRVPARMALSLGGWIQFLASLLEAL
ncbi:MAG TPA: M1 family metallopeptidase [Anaeromyxobacteraceae bacterium]|nr:M1 family metallopeptidase [Anaeromyxobacteraceae bacterium]